MTNDRSPIRSRRLDVKHAMEVLTNKKGPDIRSEMENPNRLMRIRCLATIKSR